MLGMGNMNERYANEWAREEEMAKTYFHRAFLDEAAWPYGDRKGRVAKL